MVITTPAFLVKFDDEDDEALPEINLRLVEWDPEKDHLEQLYRILDCEMVQVVHPKIMGNRYTMYVDEEGKLDHWLPTYPLKDNEGNVCDIVANSYILFKEESREDESSPVQVQMGEGELQALMAHMRVMFKEAITRAREIIEKAAINYD